MMADVFVHYSDILEEGDMIEFEIVVGSKGPQGGEC